MFTKTVILNKWENQESGMEETRVFNFQHVIFMLISLVG